MSTPAELLAQVGHVAVQSSDSSGAPVWTVVVSAVTAGGAVAGLVVTWWLNRADRRAARDTQQQSALLSSSTQLAAPNPAERAVGMAAAVEHFTDPLLGPTARRIALNALHFETQPLIVEHAVHALRTCNLGVAAVGELLDINRNLWRSTLELFDHAIATESATAAPGDLMLAIDEQLEQLRRNQQIISRLIKGETIVDLDFADTFLPGLAAVGTTFSRCDFAWAFLHYASMRDATFLDCDLTRSLLIGAYLERSRFVRCLTDRIVVWSARLHSPASEASDLPPPILASAATSCTRFVYEVEEHWRGHWEATTADGFHARWWSPADDEEVTAALIETGGGFKRERSSDGNDGTYELRVQHDLDHPRRVTLIGGVRTLRSGVPGLWRGISWTGLSTR